VAIISYRRENLLSVATKSAAEVGFLSKEIFYDTESFHFIPKRT